MAHFRPLPSREELLEHLKYDPETGLFWWIKVGKQRTFSGPVGSKRYRKTSKEPETIVIGLYRKLWVAHRLAWRIITGNDPERLTVDHINRNPFDNRWENLRLADFSLQARNRRCYSASGHKGVCFDFHQRKWTARAWQNERQVFLGRFATKEEAAAAAAPYYIP